MKKILIPIALLAVTTFHTYAQSRNVTGRVTGKNGEALIGATITDKESGMTTISDENGDFSIEVDGTNNVLIVSYDNLPTQEIVAGGNNNLMITLDDSRQQLTDVVVTALGIERTRNQVSYSSQKVSGDEVSANRSANLAGSLSGKIAGLDIRQNNTLGGSTNVVIRGVKSITGSNQALFVIDGVPVNNDNMNSSYANSGSDGYDYGNPASDLNPDDVENVTVLKGAAASALYGSRGSNGVILITTKKAKKRLNLTVNSGVTIGKVDNSTLPKYQNKYGGGYGPYYGHPDNPFLVEDDINGDGVMDMVVPFTEDASYGAAFDPNLLVFQWDALDPTSPNYMKATPWKAAANGPSSFFVTPVSNTNSISISNGYDQGTFKATYTRADQRGILPNSRIINNSFSFGTTYNILKNLTIGADANYYNTKGLGRYGTGYDGGEGKNVMTMFRQWWQTNVDLQEQKAAYERSGNKNVTWNWSENKPMAAPIYWNNPYYTRYQNYQNDERNRYLGNVRLEYKPLEWLNLLGRVTLDKYTQIQEERNSIGSTGVSGYNRFNRDFTEMNYDFIANAQHKATEDILLTGLLGLNVRTQRIQSIYAETNGGLIVPNIYSLSNSVNPIVAPSESDLRKQINGIFAQGGIVYKDAISLTATLRRDVSSTLPAGNNVYYYPSIATGITFSEWMTNKNVLNFGKVNINYAEVGNDAPIYATQDYFSVLAPFDGRSRITNNSFKNNNQLRPERTKSFEIGAETEWFNSRLGANITYYRTLTVDQILPVSVSTATGFSSKYLNSGKVENKGWELSLWSSPVKTSNFEWKTMVNWTRNRNKVLELFVDDKGQAADNLLLQSFQGGVSVNATLGEPFGTIRGSNFQYLNGEKVVGANGYYLQSETSNEVIGNMNPDWMGGWNNRFTYKGLSFSFLIDVKKGGSVFSLDRFYGLATGLYDETALVNDLGNPSRNSIADGGGIILPGVKEDGSANNTRVRNDRYGLYGYVRNPAAGFVYDASYVKLREVILSYSIPNRYLGNAGKFFKGIDLSFSGRNLWIIYKNLPYADPEDGLSFGNLNGYQVGSYPNVKQYNFNVKFNF